MTDTKLFADANETDKKIPRDLLMQYQGKWYILYAGLLWKAYQMFQNGFGIETDIVENKPDYALVKATLTTANGIKFTNYGEASYLNVTNPMMRKYMLHLAITRASCRVLRAATACGYSSYEEVFEGNNAVEVKELPETPEDNKPIDAALRDSIEKLCTKKGITPEYDFSTMTMRQAREQIRKLSL